MSADPTPDTNPTQLVRYLIRIEGMNDDASIQRVRQHLTNIGLLVDRIEPGEAEVAAAHAAGLNTSHICDVLREAGFEAHIDTRPA